MSQLLYINPNTGVLYLWIALVGFIGILYYVALYLLVNRSGRPTLAREMPPNGLSPAAVRYLYLGAYDADCLLAAVLNAAVKNCYRIKWRAEAFTISLANHGLLQTLSEDESAALSFNPALYRKKMSISRTHSKFTESAGDSMQKTLRKKYGDLLFPREIFALIAAVISVGLILGLSYLFVPIITKPLSKALLIYAPMIAIAFLAIFQKWPKRSWSLVPFVLLGLIGVYGLLVLELESELMLSAIVVPISATHIGGYYLMPKLKPKGFYLLVEILEFRKFLSERMQASQSLKTDETKLLPYLIALEVEFDNSAYFEPLLSQQRPGSIPLFPFN